MTKKLNDIPKNITLAQLKIELKRVKDELSVISLDILSRNKYINPITKKKPTEIFDLYDILVSRIVQIQPSYDPTNMIEVQLKEIEDYYTVRQDKSDKLPPTKSTREYNTAVKKMKDELKVIETNI